MTKARWHWRTLSLFVLISLFFFPAFWRGGDGVRNKTSAPTIVTELCADFDNTSVKHCSERPDCTFVYVQEGRSSSASNTPEPKERHAFQSVQADGVCVVNFSFLKHLLETDCQVNSRGDLLRVLRDLHQQQIVSTQTYQHLRGLDSRSGLCCSITSAFFGKVGKGAFEARSPSAPHNAYVTEAEAEEYYISEIAGGSLSEFRPIINTGRLTEPASRSGTRTRTRSVTRHSDLREFSSKMEMNWDDLTQAERAMTDTYNKESQDRELRV